METSSSNLVDVAATPLWRCVRVLHQLEGVTDFSVAHVDTVLCEGSADLA
jgi:hypothetical protein